MPSPHVSADRPLADWTILAGSLVAVAGLVLACHLLVPPVQPRLSDETEARRMADALLNGFAASRIALDRDSATALLQADDGRVALLMPHGAGHLARILGPEARLLPQADGALLLYPDGRRGLVARLRLGSDALDWGRRIEEGGSAE